MLEKIICNLIASKQDDHHMDTVASQSTPPKSTQVVTQSYKTDKVTMDTSIPRFGPRKLASSAPEGTTVLESPLEFLEKFHAQASNIYGLDFEKVCSRLLYLAVLDDDQQYRLARSIEKPTETLNWEKCEQLFMDALFTTLEKGDQAKAAIIKGIRPGESYQEYAWRLKGIVRI